ncbi:hypothetical protein Tsubulata_006728 [Turnera subulata]|uniref:Uncharacterized protein n=1 Tax=Turnera subulata TaxID=218843 RepID=A0A9Q0GGY0_9ROSI|nr:hypothetical protein Tsubulata_006728 [Turnera subulata]
MHIFYVFRWCVIAGMFTLDDRLVLQTLEFQEGEKIKCGFGENISKGYRFPKLDRLRQEANSNMSASDVQQKPKTGSTPQILVLDKAYKLAEQWVNNMSKGVEDEPKTVETEGRPARLGLGAKVVKQSEVRHSNDPIERKLHAKLQAGKNKVARSTEDTNPSARDVQNDEDDDSEGELESRTSSFTKKRPGPPAPSTNIKKKQK